MAGRNRKVISMHKIRHLVLACTTLMAFQPARAATRPTLTTLYSFESNMPDGAGPLGLLTVVNGTLYGTTTLGGDFASGAIYSTDLKGNETLLYSFKGGITDGARPFAGLISANGMFYGTTLNGGANGFGTVFQYNSENTPQETPLYSFKGGGDGSGPGATVSYHKGTLFGTTRYGGGTACGGVGCGTVYRVDAATGAESVLYKFKGAAADDGATPAAPVAFFEGLINHVEANALFGTTSAGGSIACVGGAGCGTIFYIDLSAAPSTAYKVLYTFTGPNGALPSGPLLYINGLYYGTATYGGDTGCGGNGCGVLFTINPATLQIAIVETFTGMQGGNPECGVTAMGISPSAVFRSFHRGVVGPTGPSQTGPSQTGPSRSRKTTAADGLIYYYDTVLHKETALAPLPGAGGVPQDCSSLLYYNGSYYGTTYHGGSKQSGTVFQFTP